MLRWRGGAAVALLGVALLVAVLLAAQAVGTARYHRVAAERALRDYGQIAAVEFARRAEGALTDALLFTALRPALAVDPTRGGALPGPGILADTSGPVRGYDLRTAGRTHGYFRISLVAGPDPILMEHLEPTPEIERWLIDSVRAHAARLAPTNRYFGCLTGPPGPDPLFACFLVRYRARVPVVAYGILSPFEAVTPVFSSALERPLLPLAGVAGVAPESLMTVLLREPGGRPLFRSSTPLDTTFAARTDLGVQYAGLSVVVAVRPEAAGLLIIGGLPRSRLPIALVLVGLSAGLLGVAIALLRREAELARLRADFVASVSHELRTPLAQIRMFAETLLLGRVRSDAERQRSLAIVQRESARLTQLVDNLLTFARRPAATTPAEEVAADLLVREVVEAFTPLAAVRGARLETDVPPGLRFRADPDALRQILLNLLDNAVKYGPEGQAVRVRAVAGADHVRLEVADEGPGIPPADRERVFERFERLDPAGVTGTGIGLAVVRELVEHHRGRAWVEDAGAGRGARFVVELPT